MMRGILKIAVIVALMFAFFLPARYFLKKNSLDHKLRKQEAETIGSVDKFNPRVKDIQQILLDTRQYAGSLDGKMGDKTRLAIRKFQGKKGLAATGFIDSKTFAELNKQEFANKNPEKPKTVLKAVKSPDPTVKA